MGEALIMTGLGLAVAIPAVVGYNWLTRANRVMLSKLDACVRTVHLRLDGPAARHRDRAGRRRAATVAAPGGGLGRRMAFASFD